jgi:hypothetical protein
MVVYTASISLKVDKVESAITSLQLLTEKYKGYVASVSTGAERARSFYCLCACAPIFFFFGGLRLALVWSIPPVE